MTDKDKLRELADIADEEWKRFLDSMDMVKSGRTNEGQPNRPGCRFPHCNKPWERCGDER